MTRESGENGAPRRTFRYSEEVAISYEVRGGGEIPIVFLHGFAAALTTWHDLAPLFPPASYTLYLLDLKGFGRSSKPAHGRYTVEEQAAVAAAFLEGLGLTDAVLVGHSLGGGIALLAYLSLRERGVIGRLVLIDCAAYPQRLPPIMSLLRVPLLGWCILHFLPLPFMVRFTLRQIFHNRRAITPERVARYVAVYQGRGIGQVFIESCRQLTPDRYAALAGSYREVAIPTLIIWGKDDRIINIGHGIRLSSEIPGARLVIIKECGHNPHEERPAETYAVIRDFLEGTEG